MKNNPTIVIMSWWCNLGNGDMENQPSDAHSEQFCTNKSLFTALARVTVLCSYRISLGNMKDKNLKELS